MCNESSFKGNRLTVLPPELGRMDWTNARNVLKLDNNPWVPPIEDQLALGVNHVIELIRTETYAHLHARHVREDVPPPEKSGRAERRGHSGPVPGLSRRNSRSSLTSTRATSTTNGH